MTEATDPKLVEVIAKLRHECAQSGPCSVNGDGCICTAEELNERYQRGAKSAQRATEAVPPISDELKPCAHCEGAPSLRTGSDFTKSNYSVYCRSCHASTGVYLTEADARSAWNRRASEAVKAEVVETAKVLFREWVGGIQSDRAALGHIPAVQAPMLADIATEAFAGALYAALNPGQRT